jgi:acyl carrier protein
MYKEVLVEIMTLDVATQIRDYIARNMLFSEQFDYDDKASFLEERIVDSLGVIELVGFVEQQFGVAVDDQELTPENFDSVQRIADYLSRKLGGLR